jgi:uncharacterized phage-like protein YoqJ
LDSPYRVTAGTGHRELLAGDPAWVTDQLPRACAWLRAAGMQYGISGMALGFDLDWAEAVLDAGMKLCIAIPFEEQPARWTRANKARWWKIRKAATRERVIGTIPTDLPPRSRSGAVNRLLFERNKFMFDHAGAAFTVWEPGRVTGGTAAALLYASLRHHLPGVWLDPVNRKVNFRLPGRADLELCALENDDCRHVALITSVAIAEQRLAALTAAGFTDWRIRHARQHERHDDGCGNCIEQLARTSQAGVPSADA